MEYTADQIGYKVREISQILSTVDDAEELAHWISDIVMDSSNGDKDKAISILENIQEIIDFG